MAAPDPLHAALAGRCPRCGEGRLFAGIVRFAPRCTGCGLDFAGFNVGDGPAAFLILLIGGAMVALAIGIELAASPPFWVYLLIFPPLTALAVTGALRIGKATLLALEYRNAAREGRRREP